MDETKQFRQCLGKFATGVTVVTCSDETGKPYGITANSFSSVSLEPRLILWNIAKVSNSLQTFLDAEHFAVNVLAADQQALSVHFAQSDHTLFDSVRIERSAQDVPLIPGALACFECRTRQIHDCGDHHIIIGEVLKFQATAAEPLVFFGGQYATIR
jgi:3-hydroxy-9,10-secoandrosta-1,3,5(10)-triene-9,17-dione monooxygenase reductase component